jgi:endonuclease YncB( thermonuclease family)
MKPFWKILITLGVIAGVSSITIFIFQTNQPSIALTERWIVTDIIDGQTLTVRQTDGSQMQVRLCGIDALKSQYSKISMQAFDSQAKERLQSLVAAADNQVMNLSH